MSQWSPGLKGRKGRSLYGALYRRLVKNGGRVAGMIWYQGESDASPELAAFYPGKMEALIKALRRDAGNARLPIVMVQIGRVMNWGAPEAWNAIQEHQRRLGERLPQVLTVPAVDLPLDDGIHIGYDGQVTLGYRLAGAMDALCRGRAAGWMPPRFAGVRVEAARGLVNLVLDYDRVVGGLQSAGRPSGFMVRKDGSHQRAYDTRLDGARVILRTDIPVGDVSNAELWYGAGIDPYCNITDAAGRPLPVMGPVAVGTASRQLPFIRVLRVSRLMPGAGDLAGLVHPGRPADLDLTARAFPTDFCDMHDVFEQAAPHDSLLYFACRFECQQSLRLAALLGYDGPVKAWLDGKERYHDPAGTNPARMDQGRFEFVAKAGSHELLVALGSHGGRAWGIYLRLESVAASGDLLVAGTGLPRVLG